MDQAKLYVLVVGDLHEQHGLPREIVSGQYVIRSVKTIVSDTKKDGKNRRDPAKIGHVERSRYRDQEFVE